MHRAVGSPTHPTPDQQNSTACPFQTPLLQPSSRALHPIPPPQHHQHLNIQHQLRPMPPKCPPEIRPNDRVIGATASPPHPPPKRCRSRVTFASHFTLPHTSLCLTLHFTDLCLTLHLTGLLLEPRGVGCACGGAGARQTLLRALGRPPCKGEPCLRCAVAAATQRNTHRRNRLTLWPGAA
jgi:hypothetical protein